MSVVVCSMFVFVVLVGARAEHYLSPDNQTIIFGESNSEGLVTASGVIILSPDGGILVGDEPPSRPLSVPVEGQSAMPMPNPGFVNMAGIVRDFQPVTLVHSMPNSQTGLFGDTIPNARPGIVSRAPASLPRMPMTTNAPLPLPMPQMPSVPACDSTNRPLIDVALEGRGYHFSWCHDGGLSYTWAQAVLYCARLGPAFTPVSIETRQEDNFVISTIAHHSLQWVWTGGVRSLMRVWWWLSGSPVLYTNWSHTGSGGSRQPDDFQGGMEQCLAILNNFYDDGIRWHDVACHHSKPVICEASLEPH